MILTAVALITILVLVKYVVHITVTPNTGWFLFAGGLWGISFVVPGLSSSPMLLALDLYEPLNHGLANLDFKVLIPWIIGMGATVLLVARAVNYFFNKKESVAYHAVVGIVVASTLMIVPLEYESIVQLPIGILFGAVGYVVAFISEKLDLKVKEEE